jgi:hypothetical protein
MSGELKHTEVGIELTEAEYDATTAHECDGQAVGMVIYFNGTSWICKLLKDIAVTANWDIGDWKITAKQLESDVATGTPPLIVASTTIVNNLNAQYLNSLPGTSYVLKSTYDAQTILAAITDDTPTAITLAAQTILGRITGGDVAALTGAQILTILTGQAGAAFSMNSQRITTLGTPTTNGDAIRATTKITEALLESATDLKHTAGTDTALGAVGTKSPPIDADKFVFRNSAASDALVTATGTQLKSYLAISRSASLVVAANDTPALAKWQSDYSGDGTSDEAQIQSAIDALV